MARMIRMVAVKVEVPAMVTRANMFSVLVVGDNGIGVPVGIGVNVFLGGRGVEVEEGNVGSVDDKGVLVGFTVRLGVCKGVLLDVGEGDWVGLAVAGGVGESVGEGVPVLVGVGVGCRVVVGIGIGVGVVVDVGVGVGVEVGVGVGIVDEPSA